MSRLFHPLLLLIANASEHRLAKHIQYLKEELAILRARIPGEIHTKPEECARLLKFGKPLGKRHRSPDLHCHPEHKVKVLLIQGPNLNSRCERLGGLIQSYQRAA